MDVNWKDSRVSASIVITTNEKLGGRDRKHFIGQTPKMNLPPQRQPDFQIPLPLGVADITYLQFAPCTFSDDLLISSYWDGFIRCHKVIQGDHKYHQKLIFEEKVHDSPILHFDMDEDGNIYTASCDGTSKKFHMDKPKIQVVIAIHNEPISQIRFIYELNCIVTGSWDKTICYWSTQGKLRDRLLKIDSFPGCVKSIDVKYPLMAIASTKKDIWTIDLRRPNVILKICDTNLKENYTCVSLFPDRCGFIVSSIEGRCNIQWLHQDDSMFTFSFKCHREGNQLYPVTSIDWHPTYKTFSTTGSDGKVFFWDKDSRQRLYWFKSQTDAPIPCGRFNRDGSLFAYASCNDYSKGDVIKFPTELNVHVVRDKAKNSGHPNYRYKNPEFPMPVGNKKIK